MRNGPVEEEATGGAVKVNGASKRKASMGKSYKAAASDSDDDVPLVGFARQSFVDALTDLLRTSGARPPLNQ